MISKKHRQAAKKLLAQSKDKALTALRCAIKDCARCSQEDAILCADCEARYLMQLRSARPEVPGLRPETQS